jgi:IPT/TIG domain
VRIHNTVLLLIVMIFLGQVSYAVTPNITGITPDTAPVGTQVQIYGSGFGATQGGSTVTFNSIAATSIANWSDAQIVATVPSTATTGPVKVKVDGVASNTNVYFNVPGPQITSVSPSSGVVGTQVTIIGSGFQASQGSSIVRFANYTATAVSWSSTQIVATVPTNTSTGPVTVSVNGVLSNQDVVFTLPNPNITGLVPSNAPVGAQVQINGSGFGPTQGSSTVSFNSVAVTSIASWSDAQIVATVPSTATTGAVRVTVGGVTSNANIVFNVPAPQIASISPSSGEGRKSRRTARDSRQSEALAQYPLTTTAPAW